MLRAITRARTKVGTDSMAESGRGCGTATLKPALVVLHDISFALIRHRHAR